MEIEDIRKKIDETDKEIVQLIAKRQSYAPIIAATKKKKGIPILQSKREADILSSRKSLAEASGLDPDLILKIFNLILENGDNGRRKKK